MSTYKFDYNGKAIEVVGPPGTTEAQARAVFQQQVNSGALVGLKTGDAISAAYQASKGVPGSTAAVGQTVSGVPGSTNGALGPAFSTTGKSFVSAGSGVTDTTTQTLSNINNSTLKGVPTNGITTADFAKTAPTMSSIQTLNPTQVRATVAQAATLSGQSADQITDTGGVGQFGFSGTQLETAGLIKPGTVGTYLTNNSNSLTDVLKSPAVWTGKDGINSLDNLLSNPVVQNTTQQSLMSSGLSSVQQLGIPIAALSAKALSGLSLNAAKSPAQTFNWARGKLPPDAQAQFDATARDGAFAIGTADQKFNDAMTQQAPPGEAENTVDRQTLDAATTRIFGNAKIPSFKYGSEDRDPAVVADRKALRKETATVASQFDTLVNEIDSTTPDQADAKIAQFNAIYTQFVAFIKGFEALKSRALNGKPYSASLVVDLEKDIAGLQDAIVEINRLIRKLQNLKKQNQI
jgi:hypothetical protein